MRDPRINRQDVLAAIYSIKNQKRIIWSPCTTLVAMGLDRYPFMPRDKYRQMKRLLHELEMAGLLVRRSRLHAYYMFKEVAYERADPTGC